ncbi:MAG TPA: methyltransferase domain-containing protein [Candidatus Dormibacteraeota bacterium]|nr:methyltransferase domain-containing protein [Candidatus Dormibacteraeota bacterium]
MNGTLYDALTWMIERSMLGPLRRELLASLTGAVVEVGAGTGLNFRYYAPEARVLAMEPDPSMARRASKRAAAAQAAIELRVGDDAMLETLPPQSVDAVVFVLVLCTIDDPLRALRRAARVLKPRGRLVVMEHVRSPGRLGRWQDRLAPVWRRLADGCSLNRDTAALLAQAGFETAGVRERRISRIAPIQHLIVGAAYSRQ